MNIKERTEYTNLVFLVYLRIFMFVFIIGLLHLIIGVVHGLIDGNGLTPILTLQLFLFILGAAVATGWVIAAAPGGGMLILEYFRQKKIKINVVSAILLIVFSFPVGIFTAVPFAIYNVVKFKVPIEIEFKRSGKSSRKK